MHSVIFLCLMALLLSPVVFLGQIPLSGQLEGQSCGDYSRLRFQLWDIGKHNASSETYLNPLGSFEFSSAPTGIFGLRVINWQGDTISTQSVTLTYINTLRLKMGSGSFAQARMPVSLLTSVHADSLSSQARFFLAISLLEQKSLPKEAMFPLSNAKDQFEPARKLWLRLAVQQFLEQSYLAPSLSSCSSSLRAGCNWELALDK